MRRIAQTTGALPSSMVLMVSDVKLINKVPQAAGGSSDIYLGQLRGDEQRIKVAIKVSRPIKELSVGEAIKVCTA